MRSECVRGLGGLPYLGKPRPLPLLNSSTRNLSTKIPRPECSGNLGELRPRLAGGGPSCGERDRIPAGVFARQPPWKDSTLSNRTASPGRDDGPQDQKPLGDSAPLPAAGVPFPACSLARSQRAVPEQRVPAFKHQVRKMLGRRGAQGCPEGFQSPTADGGNGEGRENRCCGCCLQ